MKRKLALVGLLVLALTMLLAPTALAGSTWYVNGVTGNDTNNCKTPQTACKTVGHAISLASSGDTISVAAATYKENLTIPFSLTIHGDFGTSAPTIIDGGGVNTVVTIPNAGSVVQFSNVTIQDGVDSEGGGVYNNAALTIAQSAIVNNHASQGSGGGVYNNGKLAITGSTISGNDADYSSGGGGGIFNNGTLWVRQSRIDGNGTFRATGGGLNNVGRAAIVDSTLSGNGAELGGGAIENDGTLTISQSTINGNSGTTGGIASGGSLTIDHSTVSGNSSGGYFGGAGGGITSSGSLTITNTTLSGNIANDVSASGGGILNSGTARIKNSTISGNNARAYGYSGTGGGVYNYGILTITDSTFNGNSATGPDGSFGGGIDNAGMLTINNSTFSGNGADNGGDIDSDSGGSAAFQNTIVANSLSGGNCYINGGSIVSIGFNLSSDGSCPFNSTGDLNNTDPKLGPLQNNGGPTWTMALLASSPAIDAGNPNGCTDGNGKLLKTDQRGQPRPDPEDLGIGCDMGAYELQGD